MRLFYGLCQLVHEQKGVLEHPEHPPGYAIGVLGNVSRSDRAQTFLFPQSWVPVHIHHLQKAKSGLGFLCFKIH